MKLFRSFRPRAEVQFANMRVGAHFYPQEEVATTIRPEAMRTPSISSSTVLKSSLHRIGLLVQLRTALRSRIPVRIPAMVQKGMRVQQRKRAVALQLGLAQVVRAQEAEAVGVAAVAPPAAAAPGPVPLLLVLVLGVVLRKIHLVPTHASGWTTTLLPCCFAVTMTRQHLPKAARNTAIELVEIRAPAAAAERSIAAVAAAAAHGKNYHPLSLSVRALGLTTARAPRVRMAAHLLDATQSQIFMAEQLEVALPPPVDPQQEGVDHPVSRVPCGRQGVSS
mmetsp:Transcript_21540/g.54297  ORF Transcript_21540/g.54297 Transcript_21540/m.54297 type:complete len:279 (+) Transcript_21540:1882-2718(+)